MEGPPLASPADRGLIVASALAAAVFCSGLAMLDGVATGAPSAGPTVIGLQRYWAGAALAWGMLSVLAWRLSRAAPSMDTAWSAYRRKERIAGWIVLGVAFLLRAWVIHTTTPQLSDDMHRYVFDGRIVAAGANPYLRAPSAWPHLDPINEQLVPRINNPGLATIYLPTSQWLFGAVALAGDPASDPFGYGAYRLAFVLIEMCTVLLLMRMLALERRTAWWAALYAWHPLAISEVAGSGHQDVLGIFLVVAALAVLGASKPHPGRVRLALAGAIFALGVCVKPVILPLLVPIVWRFRRRILDLAALFGAAAVAAGAVALPFACMEGGLAGLWDTGRIFAGRWSHNGSIHALLTYLFGLVMTDGAAHAWASCVAVLLLLVVMAVVAWRGVDFWVAAVACLFAAPLLSSTVHPWYLLWAMTLLPLRFHAPLWLLTWTVTWSYAVWLDPAWHLPTWIVVASYAPVYALLAGQVARGLTRRRATAA